ncbi:MAG TPA: Vps62-related protein [Thermoanaerobaculia bacterium]|jgi:hypothetical protein|nr:Vps62-related protein [Thermoanaerobaculia bacterium]
MSLPPVLVLSTTSRFERIWWDKGSGADMDGAFYRPQPQDGFFILGDYGQGNYNSPNGTALTIRVDQDDPNQPALKPPDDYVLVYSDKGSGADEDGSFWAPIPPFGYVVCGHVVQRGYQKPSVPSFRCLRYDLAKSVTIAGNLIWNDRGSGAEMDVSIYRNLALNTIYAVASYDTPTETTNAPKVLNG